MAVHHPHPHRHHDTGQAPALSAGMGSSSTLGIALVLTVGYALLELLSGLWFGSLALLSDAGHMFSDAVALGLAWFAAWLSQRPAGLRHSFGLARAEVVAGFVNGLSMLLVVILIVVEAIRRLLAPSPVEGLGVLIVAFVGLLLNLAVAFMISRGERNLNTRAALLHVMSDVLGSVVALVAGAVIYFTGWMSIDPILSLVIALLILGSTLHLLREALHVLMEGVPSAIRLEEVGHALARLPGVQVCTTCTSGTSPAAGWRCRPIWSCRAWIAGHRCTGSQHAASGALQIEHVTLQPELAGDPAPAPDGRGKAVHSPLDWADGIRFRRVAEARARRAAGVRASACCGDRRTDGARSPGAAITAAGTAGPDRSGAPRGGHSPGRHDATAGYAGRPTRAAAPGAWAAGHRERSRASGRDTGEIGTRASLSPTRLSF
jgi:cobalt-zinc-cadmium efflux system protein